jgi:hypothetical protein
MATPEEQKMEEQTSASAGFKPAEKETREKLSLDDSLNKLARVGGIDLLESTIDGLQNLNP